MGSEELLLEAGKSSELTAIFHTLAETDVEGEAKFSPMVCREIGKLIVCRTYATPLLELCHLVVAAGELSLQKGRYEFFFWDSGVAKSSSFFAYCQQLEFYANPHRLKVNSQTIDLTYKDGEFAIQYSRMPVLSALLEFMLSALGYCDMDDALKPLSKHDATKQDVSEAANSLSRKLYGYLKEHLPTAQSQRKFRKILSYCDNDADVIDDALILNFWQTASIDDEKGVDFKTFDSVVLTFIRVIQAVKSARDLSALRHAGSIGGDHEAGEINPDLLSETLESVEETITPLVQLNQSPFDQVKFLNKQEQTNLTMLLNAGELALRLPLSVLRSDVFSPPQARLTQALRRKAKNSELNEIIKEGPKETYQERQIIYQKLCRHIEHSLYASLHALATARSKEAISIILKLAPGIDFSGLHNMLNSEKRPTNVISLPSKSITDHFMDLLHDPDQVGEDVAKVMSQAETAYKGLARKGFKEDVRSNDDLVEAFSKGADLLGLISQDIDAYLERLDNLPLAGGGWHAQYSYDRSVFDAQFSKIYGGNA
ncbi:MAG: hypothetical protein HWE30_17320 [Methylocystaceae bacterium]|nr:hypothetical protein [Methylocystaceae bacterium]